MQVTNIVKVNDRPQPSMSLAFSSEVRLSTGLPGLRLEKHGKIYVPNNVGIIVPLLDAEKHRDIIYSFEYHGMVGKPDALLERISNYYRTGISKKQYYTLNCHHLLRDTSRLRVIILLEYDSCWFSVDVINPKKGVS